MLHSIFGPEEQATSDFNRQHQRGSRHRLLNSLLGKSSDLADFKTTRAKISVGNQHDGGLQVVAVDDIHGSVGRTHDFDDAFYPIHESSRHRWCAVAAELYRGHNLPPVELYHVDDDYYVIDGNHRISVMKAIGQEFVEAQVIEIETVDSRCQTQEMPAPRFDH